MNPKKFKIILVDDHTLLRDALSSLIHSFEEFSVINSLNNGTELIRALSEGYKPDIVLLDLNMPILDGFETAKWLNVNYPEIKILILTMYDSEIALIRLLKVGVKGFLKKDTHPNELRVALNSVSENGYYYSQDTTGKLANLFQKNTDNQNFVEKAMLNESELEFLRLASTDLTYKEIAAQLNLSPRAIDGYRDSLFEKLDVKSRVGLAIYAVKNGIVRV
ncbi:MAG: response regulator transcription factor [Sphingobacteriales bacterium]|jgi:DNA-binding NarL/FixJ family response regulator|nr:response regulator transcription factor [Sphingobacteriales bacterium]